MLKSSDTKLWSVNYLFVYISNLHKSAAQMCKIQAVFAKKYTCTVEFMNSFTMIATHSEVNLPFLNHHFFD